MRFPIALTARLYAAILVALAASTPLRADGWARDWLTTGLGSGVAGSGTLQKEMREVGDFDAIDLQDSNDLEVRFGPKSEVTVEADDNILKLVATQVDDHTLKIRSTKSFHSRLTPRIIVTIPLLSRLSVSGSGNARLNRIAAAGLSLTISGSGDIKADGHADDLRLRVNGSGDADLSALQARSAIVTVNGSGDAMLNVTENLDAIVNGSGDIRYRGTPAKISTRVHGSGEVSSR